MAGNQVRFLAQVESALTFGFYYHGGATGVKMAFFQPAYFFGLLLFALLVWPTAGQCGQIDSHRGDLFQHDGVIMLLIDPGSGAIVDANQTAADYYGYPREELLTMTIQQINTFSAAQVEQEFKRAAREQRNYFLFEHRLADGQIRPVEVYSWPVRRNGERLLLFSIIHDISHRRQMEQSVIDSEARLRFAEQVAGIGHWTLDLHTNTYTFSEGALALLGLEEKIWPAAAIREMVSAQSWQQMAQLKQELLDGTREYRLDLRFERPDGVVIDLHTEGLYDADTRSLFGIVHDTSNYHDAMRALSSRTALFLLLAGAALVVQLGVITLLIYNGNRRKKAEEELRDSGQRFDQLAWQNRSVVWEVDHTGRYTYISDVARAVFGYDPEEIINRMYFYDLHPAAERNQFKEKAFAVMQQKEVFRDLENPIVCKSGQIIWVATTGMPLLNKQGTLVGYRGSDTDINERKQAQAAVEMKNREMEQFVYAVSHDLKSPLITMRMFLNALKEDIDNSSKADIAEDFFHLHGAADKMGQLLDALHRLSQAGHFSDQPVPVPVKELVANCMTTLAGAIEQRQVDINMEDFPQVLWGDALRLEQIWQNLIENAIKYMGNQPQPLIEIGYEGSGKDTVFFVRDNGMGIDPHHVEKIFGLFSQLDARSEGIGLGLALVKKVVESYQGNIRVESGGPGQGSCFKFTLPGAFTAERS